MPKDFTAEELDLIRKQFFPPAGSAAEWQTCIAVARELGLSPILKEIHFMARRQRHGDQWISRVEPLVGRDGFLSVAHRTGMLAGMDSTASVQVAPRLTVTGWETHPDLVAECRVWRKDAEQPFVVTVAFAEYVQKGQDGNPTRFWAEKPETMLKKVAESQALRKAFNIHGVYAPEELGLGIENGGEIVSDHESPQVAPAPLRRADPPKTVTNDPTTSTGEQNSRRASVRTPSATPPPTRAAAPVRTPPLHPVLAACQAKGITVEQRGDVLVARSYQQRDFLKAQGFRWDGQQRSWIYTPLTEAA